MMFFYCDILHLKGGIYMLNQVILVGRLVRTPELQLTETGKKRSLITLAVNRGYKNQDGEYETDFLDCTLWTGIAENTAEYCRSGDVIGVKGRLQTWLIDNEDGTKHKKMEIIADKVTFLASSRKNSNLDNDTISLDDEETEDGESTDIQVIKESEKKYKRKKKQ